MIRKLSSPLLASLLLTSILTMPSGVVRAADPEQGTVSKKQDVTWTGGPFFVPNPAACTSDVDPTCDHFLLTVDGKDGTRVAVAITTDLPAENDFDLFVYAPDGTLLASSATASGNETLVFAHSTAFGGGPYEVRVQPWLVNPGATYEGVAMRTREPVDVERECLQPVPESVSLDFTQPVTLDVKVLLDGVSKSRGKKLMGDAARSYAPINVSLRSSFRTVDFATDDADELIQAAKDLYGGTRPNGFDLVYVLTSKDIQLDDDNGVAGLADCIGGVRFDDTAFAVGEDFGEEEDDGRPLGPFVHTVDGSAVVAAHELGHLMGAHHHYGNCVEGISLGDLQNVCSESPGAIELTPCTLMFNFVNFASLPFSTVNKGVVRGNALDHAQP